MKVVVLGAGGMGTMAAMTVATFPYVHSVVVADLKYEAAARLAATIGQKSSAAAVDVSDPKQLAVLFSDVDIILNTVGPFYRFGVPVLEAAIRAGKPYADINDDWQPTLEMLTLHEKAQAAGVTAVIGLGASPGISNMLAMSAARQLDRVDVLLTGWDTLEAMNDPGALTETPSAALIHWMHQTSGMIRVHSDGRQTEAKPLQEFHLSYPGHGDAVVWTVGHPEPLTLPHTIPLRFSANVMTGNQELMALLRSVSRQIDEGVFTPDAAAQAFLDMLLPTVNQPVTYTGARLPALFAIAFGQKAGQPTTVAASLREMPAGGMAGATGVPLALFPALVRQGALHRPGVFPPEAVLAPDDFFTLLAGQIMGGHASAADLLQVNTASVARFAQAHSA